MQLVIIIDKFDTPALSGTPAYRDFELGQILRDAGDRISLGEHLKTSEGITLLDFDGHAVGRANIIP